MAHSTHESRQRTGGGMTSDDIGDRLVLLIALVAIVFVCVLP